MDYIGWAIMIVWFFLLVIGRIWKEPYFSIGGGIVGLVLMIEVLDDSFVFAFALFVINAYIIWTSIMAEM